MLCFYSTHYRAYTVGILMNEIIFQYQKSKLDKHARLKKSLHVTTKGYINWCIFFWSFKTVAQFAANLFFKWAVLSCQQKFQETLWRESGPDQLGGIENTVKNDFELFWSKLLVWSDFKTLWKPVLIFGEEPERGLSLAYNVQFKLQKNHCRIL